ncbi:FIST N-terminal domain-containing protein [Primorskyibacter sp. S87]|uniref:FIST N-terminal domain-containing protein n=1 Tax=Primorskyibacter sp. S87 TaxID=3415126 RepID=UPI003C7C3E79
MGHGLVQALSGAGEIVRSAFASTNAANSLSDLARDLAAGAGDLVVLFVSPTKDINHLAAEADRLFAPARVVGCTTAGELADQGYSDGGIVAVLLPRSHFCSRILPIPDLSGYDTEALNDQNVRNRNEMIREEPDWASEFALLLVDGHSLKEDALVANLGPSLGPVPLFGGSAGDGTAFGPTFILCGGRAVTNAAVLVQIRTRCPIKVFKTDHLVPTEQRMVVTGANPAARIVHEINAEPAAREYARLLGKDSEQLTTFTFAAHPVVVRFGDQHHVRSIQRVAENGDLVFFSAIDEGVVLTLADTQDMVEHLKSEMHGLSASARPDIILACDCILRRMEAQQKQKTREISQILADNRVVGFCTYGEQVNSMHVNQTLTGVAIYPPAEV